MFTRSMRSRLVIQIRTLEARWLAFCSGGTLDKMGFTIRVLSETSVERIFR